MKNKIGKIKKKIEEKDEKQIKIDNFIGSSETSMQLYKWLIKKENQKDIAPCNKLLSNVRTILREFNKLKVSSDLFHAFYIPYKEMVLRRISEKVNLGSQTKMYMIGIVKEEFLKLYKKNYEKSI